MCLYKYIYQTINYLSDRMLFLALLTWRLNLAVKHHLDLSAALYIFFLANMAKYSTVCNASFFFIWMVKTFFSDFCRMFLSEFSTWGQLYRRPGSPPIGLQ